MGVKVCFTADLHGNTEHLKRILRCARDQGCDTVVLGGDLGPVSYTHLTLPTIYSV